MICTHARTRARTHAARRQDAKAVGCRPTAADLAAKCPAVGAAATPLASAFGVIPCPPKASTASPASSASVSAYI